MANRFPGVDSARPILPPLVMDASLPHFDVRDTRFGAVGNGTTDDTTAIQAAINACQSATGGVVVLPPTAGNTGYKVTSTLNITSDGVVLVGGGHDQRAIVYTGTGAAVQFGTSSTYVYRCGTRGMRINNTSGSAAVGLELFCRESIFEDTLTHQGFSTAGWRLNGTSAPAAGCWTNRFLDCYAYSHAGDGMQLLAQSNAVMLFGCHFSSNTGSAIWAPLGNGVKLIACQFEQTGNGIEIDVSDRSGAVAAGQQIGFSVIAGYFELKSGTGSRALKFSGTTSAHWDFTSCLVNGNGANYAVESSVSTGTSQGDLRGGYVHNTLLATALASGSGNIINVQDHQGLTGVFPAGSALPLLATASSGAGNTISQGNGQLNITGLVAPTGTIKPRRTAIGSSATPTIDPATTDHFVITALATNMTSITLNSTPQQRQRLWVTITDNGTPRTLAWGSSFESSSTVSLPTTTVTSTQMEVEFVQNEVANKFRCVRVS